MPYLYLAPWDWATEGDMSFWRMPRADVGLGLFDLRSLPQCADAGTQFPIRCFSALSEPAPIGVRLGDSWGSLIRAPLRRAVSSELGLGQDALSSAANTPLTLLVEALTRWADPTGQARWKPLRGSLRNGVNFYLGGQRVWSQALDAIVLANTVAVFQADYRRNKADGVALTSLQKWTGSTMFKLWGQMSDELAAQLLPAEYAADGWDTPATVITESFPGDSETLGGDLTWTETVNDWDNVSGIGRAISSGSPNTNHYARAEVDLSSEDHYIQAILHFSAATLDAAGVVGRYASAAETAYRTYTRPATSFTFQVHKRVAGVDTQLWRTDETPAPTSGQLGKLTILVNSLEYFYNGLSKISGTDSSITSGTRTGIYGFNVHAATHPGVDNFEAGDLGVAARRMAVIG